MTTRRGFLAPPPGTTVTEAELLSHGIDPHYPVGNRIPSYPLDVRCGDDRYTRSASGCVSKFYGYYSQAQTAARQRMAEMLAEAMKPYPPFARCTDEAAP